MAFNAPGLKVNMILAGMVFIWLTLAMLHAIAACWAVVASRLPLCFQKSFVNAGSGNRQLHEM